MTTYSKSYPDHEIEYRYKIFRANLKKIDSLNKYEQGDAVYGVTQYADLTSKSQNLMENNTVNRGMLIISH